MSDIKLEVDENFLKDFYELLDKAPAELDKITLGDLKGQLAKVKRALVETRSKPEMKTISTTSSNEIIDERTDSEKEADEETRSVLIVDDLGVITYQLNIIFQKYGFTSYVSQEIFDALEKFKNINFDWVVMDLFIPTEREGLMLLNELQKIIKMNNLSTQIVIISASNKKEHKKLCMDRGAHYFIEKSEGWQTALCEHCKMH